MLRGLSICCTVFTLAGISATAARRACGAAGAYKAAKEWTRWRHVQDAFRAHAVTEVLSA